MKLTQQHLLIAGGTLLLGAILFPRLARSLTATTTDAVIGAARGVGEGVVLGVGDALGVSRTDAARCFDAIRRRSAWDASFYCDAPTYFDYLQRGQYALNHEANPQRDADMSAVDENRDAILDIYPDYDGLGNPIIRGA